MLVGTLRIVEACYLKINHHLDAFAINGNMYPVLVFPVVAAHREGFTAHVAFIV